MSFHNLRKMVSDICFFFRNARFGEMIGEEKQRKPTTNRTSKWFKSGSGESTINNDKSLLNNLKTSNIDRVFISRDFHSLFVYKVNHEENTFWWNSHHFFAFSIDSFLLLNKISSKCLTGNSPPKENNFKTAATEKRFNKP